MIGVLGRGRWVILLLCCIGCSSEATTSAPPVVADAGMDRDAIADASKADVAHDVHVEAIPADGDAGTVEEPEAEGGEPDVPDGPSWIVDGVAICPELAPFRDVQTDCHQVLQMCIDRTPTGLNLDIEPGHYWLSAKVTLGHPMGFRTRGRAGTAPCTADATHGCAELIIMPAFHEELGVMMATATVTVDHIVINGNRGERSSTASAAECTSVPTKNSFGYNASFLANGSTLQDSVSMYALCGSGWVVGAPASGLTIVRNTFAYNGVHTVFQLWSDGLTVLEADHTTIAGNRFIDNSDVDLILGGCPYCVIQNNTVTHTGDANAGSFVAIMIQKWPNTSGSYEGVDVSANQVDCGPLRNCGSGLYIGSESWYTGTPYGSTVPGTASGVITNNNVVNAMNALYIAAQGLGIYGNGFVNAHNIQIPNSCKKPLISITPIVVSPTASSCNFNGENDPQVNPGMAVHYSQSGEWIGCQPNYPPNLL